MFPIQRPAALGPRPLHLERLRHCPRLEISTYVRTIPAQPAALFPHGASPGQARRRQEIPICPFRSSLSNWVNICFSRFRIANRLLAEDYSTSTDYSQASIVTPLLSSRIRMG